jgi:hypothetical protein
MGERRGVYMVWWGDLMERGYWEDNIKIGFQEMGAGMYRFDLVQHRDRG